MDQKTLTKIIDDFANEMRSEAGDHASKVFRFDNEVQNRIQAKRELVDDANDVAIRNLDKEVKLAVDAMLLWNIKRGQ